jgi:hypothetical protein
LPPPGVKPQAPRVLEAVHDPLRRVFESADHLSRQQLKTAVWVSLRSRQEAPSPSSVGAIDPLGPLAISIANKLHSSLGEMIGTHSHSLGAAIRRAKGFLSGSLTSKWRRVSLAANAHPTPSKWRRVSLAANAHPTHDFCLPPSDRE